MWVSVTGPEGSCRKRIVDVLVEKNRMVYDPWSNPGYRVSEFLKSEGLQCFYNLLFRFRHQIKMMERIERTRDNIVTIGSFWEEFEVGARLMLERERISRGGFADLEYMFETIYRQLPPPDVFIYPVVESMKRRHLLSMRDAGDTTDEVLMEEDAHFRRFVDRLRPTVLEIDAGRDFKEVEEEVLFNVGTVGSSGSSTKGSLWGRRIYRD